MKNACDVRGYINHILYFVVVIIESVLHHDTVEKRVRSSPNDKKSESNEKC
jgi:hypothetical protein